MHNYILEVCADSVESAIEAQKGGADRIELCSNLIIGGTTPSIQLYQEVRKQIELPIKVLIRPRFGDFLYSNYEYEIIKNEIKMFKELNADGVVVGCLLADGTLDIKRLEELLFIAGSMPVTVNRSFDMLKNPMDDFKKMINLGVNTVLTSGQKQNCFDGMEFIQQLIEIAEGKIHVLVGGGVNADVIKQFMLRTSVTNFHLSGKVVQNSSMEYRNETVSMGLPNFSEYQIWQTNKELIADAKSVILKYGRTVEDGML